MKIEDLNIGTIVEWCSIHTNIVYIGTIISVSTYYQRATAKITDYIFIPDHIDRRYIKLPIGNTWNISKSNINMFKIKSTVTPFGKFINDIYINELEKIK